MFPRAFVLYNLQSKVFAPLVKLTMFFPLLPFLRIAAAVGGAQASEASM